MDIRNIFRTIFTFRWKPGLDLAAVLVSWALVTGALYTATVIVGSSTGGGLPYFFLYAILTATIFGVGLPLFWMAVVRKRPIADLGITGRGLGLSLAIQLSLSAVLYLTGFRDTPLPPMAQLLPLTALALAIGFFEAVFWRGWVYLRLEEAFGVLPALLVGSALYALYHIGYAMPASEIAFLFFIGLMFAVVFRLTKSIFILWPIFQPMGQLITLIPEGLPLPMIASLGFFEVLIVMLALVWLANRHYRKQKAHDKFQDFNTRGSILLR